MKSLSRGNVIYSTRKRVNNTVVICVLTKVYWACPGDPFIRYLIVGMLCCIPETNIMLYVNYTAIKNKLISES